MAIPEVVFDQVSFLLNETLWAEIDVRFDIYLRIAGALVYCDPEVPLQA
jgi:hypothetical protein